MRLLLWLTALSLAPRAAAFDCATLACAFDCDAARGCYNACAGWSFAADAANDVYNPLCVARDVRAALTSRRFRFALRPDAARASHAGNGARGGADVGRQRLAAAAAARARHRP